MLATPPQSTRIDAKDVVVGDELRLPEPIYPVGSTVAPPVQPGPTARLGSPVGRRLSDTGVASPTSSPDLPATGKVPRRKNHSEIERRRRERVNAKYNELRELVPACRAFRFARRGGDAGLHKLDILTEAVSYIHQLQKELDGAKKRDVTRISYLMN